MSKNQPVILVIILKYLQIGLRWGKLFFQYENEMYPSRKRIRDRRTFFGDQTFIWRIFFIRGCPTDADLCISQSNWTYFSGFSIPLKDDSDVPDTPYSMPDSGFSEFDFGEENENNETPTSELLRKCRIARMESTLAKVREIEISYWGLHQCWCRMLETKFVGVKFEMLVTDLIHRENHQHNEKSRQRNDSTTNIWCHQHNDVTNITVTHIEAWKSYDDGF